ncbi:hypothetical protein FB45DRAFT_1031853 [Roridomyces roridus]|uniref:Uncharacterized protein n=1 Tax=Roridomyces roridus TaxID=1738132 RepID=A0AAD7FG16_9AGAR|nr:hypothetical protein FB45DRAFT_1031853 [Roridomyces roridus]
MSSQPLGPSSEPDFGDLLLPSSEAGPDYLQLDSQPQESQRTYLRRKNRWLDLRGPHNNSSFIQYIVGEIQGEPEGCYSDLNFDELLERCIKAEADRHQLLDYCLCFEAARNQAQMDLSQTKKALRDARKELQYLHSVVDSSSEALKSAAALIHSTQKNLATIDTHSEM